MPIPQDIVDNWRNLMIENINNRLSFDEKDLEKKNFLLKYTLLNMDKRLNCSSKSILIALVNYGDFTGHILTKIRFIHDLTRYSFKSIEICIKELIQYQYIEYFSPLDPDKSDFYNDYLSIVVNTTKIYENADFNYSSEFKNNPDYYKDIEIEENKNTSHLKLVK